MKRVVMYKYFNPDRLFGGYGWSIEEVWDDWNQIYSDPYYVEIPDNFNLGENVTGEKMYFKEGCNHGYQLTIFDENNKNGSPFLIGGDSTELIKLKVVGIVPENER